MATTKKRTAKEQPTKVVGGPARMSYVHVFKPTSVHPDKPETLKYSAMLMVPKSNKLLFKELKAAQQAALEIGKVTKWANKIPEKLSLAIKDGDEDYDLDKNPEYAGHWIISAKSDTKPGIVDREKEPLTSEEEFYSGCFARFSIKFYPYNTAGNKGIGVQLNHLQKVKDGERLGGKASVDEDFAEDWEDDEDDNDDLMDD